MASITLPTRTQHEHLRPLNILRDLPAVADLIEQCFSETMDNEGRRYVQDMRRAGNDNSFIKWANRVADSTSLPLTGYIWEEDNRIVGNISVVPFRHRGKKLYLIANVAVHPNYRHRGIAGALTERALQHIHEKKIKDVWLHVRADNPEAIHIYTKLGFTEYTRRTSWQTIAGNFEITNQDIQITKRHPHFWQTQRLWLTRFYPDLLAWHQHWDISSLRPGLWNWLYLLITDVNIRQWAATKNNQLHATLSFIPHGLGKGLYAGAGDRSEPEALTALLIHARRELLHYYPKLTLDFPVSDFDEAIQNAGFQKIRTLIWMHATL
ncbi:MAG: GNAT family N-acetyltransferase [Anaerolineales bacterium]|nr:GNAT family N-acetyltransferase [Anaerolineales bacterium]